MRELSLRKLQLFMNEGCFQGEPLSRLVVYSCLIQWQCWCLVDHVKHWEVRGHLTEFMRDRANRTWPPPPHTPLKKSRNSSMYSTKGVVLLFFLVCLLALKINKIRFIYLKWGSSQYYTTATKCSWHFLCMTVNGTLGLWCFFFFFGFSFSTECWYTRPFSIYFSQLFKCI